MAALLNCDGCGATIREGSQDVNPRYRAALYEPGTRDIFELVRGSATAGWDFCSVGCMATWATEKELENTRSGGD